MSGVRIPQRRIEQLTITLQSFIKQNKTKRTSGYNNGHRRHSNKQDMKNENNDSEIMSDIQESNAKTWNQKNWERERERKQRRKGSKAKGASFYWFLSIALLTSSSQARILSSSRRMFFLLGRLLAVPFRGMIGSCPRWVSGTRVNELIPFVSSWSWTALAVDLFTALDDSETKGGCGVGVDEECWAPVCCV